MDTSMDGKNVLPGFIECISGRLRPLALVAIVTMRQGQAEVFRNKLMIS